MLLFTSFRTFLGPVRAETFPIVLRTALDMVAATGRRLLASVTDVAAQTAAAAEGSEGEGWAGGGPPPADWPLTPTDSVDFNGLKSTRITCQQLNNAADWTLGRDDR